MKSTIIGFNNLGFTLTIDSEEFIAKLVKPSTRANLGYVKQWHYRFDSLEAMEEYCIKSLNEKINIIAKQLKRKADTKLKNQKELENVKVGDVFRYSWGYDQTNIEFFQIISRPTKSTATIQSISCETVEEVSWGLIMLNHQSAHLHLKKLKLH